MSEASRAFAKIGVKLDSRGIIEEAANRQRKPKEGDLIPCVEYDWEPHLWYIGFKDWRGCWIKRLMFVPGTDRKYAAKALRILADALEESDA